MLRTIKAWQDNKALAHVAPFVVFLLFLQLVPLVKIENIHLPWYRHSPEHWIYPLQTIVVAGLLIIFQRHYRLAPFRGFGFATLMGMIGIGIWILPAELYRAWGWTEASSPPWLHYFGFQDRGEGFEPTLFREHTSLYWLVVAGRFLRMVVVVAFVEEVFWRSFVMRLLVDWDGDYWKVPFGAYTKASILVTSALIMLVHRPVDYGAAFIWGLLGCWTAVRTKSLAACIWMHAVGNLLLGIYVMRSEQWGFW